MVDTNRSAAYLPDGRYGGILDNQWLGSLLDVGALGVCALVWVFLAGYRRFVRVARADAGDDGWLAAALAAAAAAFAAGMLFFDAFSFIQVTIVFFFVLGLGAVLLRTVERPEIAEPDPLLDITDWRRRIVVLWDRSRTAQ